MLAVVAIIFLAAGFVAGLAVGRRQGPRLSPTERLTQKILGDADHHESVDAKQTMEAEALKSALLKKLDKELQKMSGDHGHAK